MKRIFLILIIITALFAGTALAEDDKKISETVNLEISKFEALGILGGTPQQFVGNIIKAFMGIVGTIALIIFVYAGITWMMAGGAPEKVNKAKNMFVWSILGLLVIFASYAIVSYIINALSKVG